MVEAILLTAFVGGIVLLMHSISRVVGKDEKRTLGFFSYAEDANTDALGSDKKS